MWVFLNNAFLSIVQPKGKVYKDFLLVRARKSKHIEAVFGDCGVARTRKRDYLYRAMIPREVVANTLKQHLMTMDYTNFKESIPHKPEFDGYYHACSRVWSTMYLFQEEELNGKTKDKIFHSCLQKEEETC
jgi:cAMP phosphodiesterase